MLVNRYTVRGDAGEAICVVCGRLRRSTYFEDHALGNVFAVCVDCKGFFPNNEPTMQYPHEHVFVECLHDGHPHEVRVIHGDAHIRVGLSWMPAYLLKFPVFNLIILEGEFTYVAYILRDAIPVFQTQLGYVVDSRDQVVCRATLPGAVLNTWDRHDYKWFYEPFVVMPLDTIRTGRQPVFLNEMGFHQPTRGFEWGPNGMVINSITKKVRCIVHYDEGGGTHVEYT